jgi:hypothetical protein
VQYTLTVKVNDSAPDDKTGVTALIKNRSPHASASHPP